MELLYGWNLQRGMYSWQITTMCLISFCSQQRQCILFWTVRYIFKLIIFPMCNLINDLSPLYIKIQEYISCLMTKRCSGIMCKCCEEIRCFNEVASRSNRKIHRKNVSIISVSNDYKYNPSVFQRTEKNLRYVIWITKIYISIICHSHNTYYNC